MGDMLRLPDGEYTKVPKYEEHDCHFETKGLSDDDVGASLLEQRMRALVFKR